jgi:hypothetical protein
MLHKSLVPTEATSQLTTGEWFSGRRVGLIVESPARAEGAIHHVDKISRV